MKQVFFMVIIFLKSGLAFTQEVYQGIVMDEEKKIISFANVVVYSKESKLLLGGVITDEEGRFKIKINRGSPCYIEVSFIGCKSIVRDIDDKTTLDLGEIILYQEENVLEEIVITKKKELIEKKSDHFLINLADRGFIKNANSWQTLKKAPLLSVKENKGLSILGKDDVVIYINDRKSNFSGDALSNYLKSLPADRISKVEIYTSPPARFDAQGNGIINIILKPNPEEGLIGSWSNVYRKSSYSAFKTSLDLNYNKGKWNVYNSIWFSEGANYVSESVEQFFPNNINTSTHETDRLTPSSLNIGYKLGVDFNMSKKHLFGVLLDINYDKPELQNKTYSNYFSNNKLDSIATTTTDGNQRKLNYNINLNHLYKIDSLGSTLSWNANYFSYDNNQYTQNKNFLNNSNEPSLLGEDNFTSDVIQKINNTNLKLDYYKVLNDKVNISAGIQYFKTNTDNEIILKRYDGSVYEVDADVSNLFEFTERVLSGYLSFKYNPSSKWNYSLGVRLEDTHQKGNQKTNDNVNINEYTNFFPSAYVKYAPSRKHVISLSLNNRIVRPSFWQLNPFRNYITPEIYSEGNPFLNPSRTFNTELSYVLQSKHTFLFNYSKEIDVIGQLSTVLTDNVLAYYRDNYGVYDVLGGMYIYNYSLFNGRFESQLTASAKYKKLTATPAFNEAFTGEGIELDLRLYNYYYFLKDKSLEACVDFYYNKYGPITQSTLSPVFSMDFTLSKSFKNWSMSMFVQDILKTDKYLFNLKEETGYKRINENYYDSRRFVLSVKYNFGSKKVKGKRSRNTNTSIRNRIN